MSYRGKFQCAKLSWISQFKLKHKGFIANIYATIATFIFCLPKVQLAYLNNYIGEECTCEITMTQTLGILVCYLAIQTKFQLHIRMFMLNPNCSYIHDRPLMVLNTHGLL